MNTGCLFRPSNTRNYKMPMGSSSNEGLPSSFMLEKAYLPEIRDQKDTDSCVGHGIAEVLEVLFFNEFGKKKVMSPWYIYGNDKCRNGYKDKGMFIQDAINGVCEVGTVPIEEFDVQEDVPKILQAVNNRPELVENAKQYKIRTYLEVPNYAMKSKKILALKQALYTYKIPIVIGSANYFGGGHCVILVGWNENDDFLFQNSWGKSYKDNGIWHIPVNEIDEAYILFDEILPIPFDDVSETDWYYKPIKTAYFSGVINGTSESTFSPDLSITRAETAAICMRVIEKTQESIDNYIKSLQQLGQSFVNVELLPLEAWNSCLDLDDEAWYYSEVSNLLSTKIMCGDETGLFRPDDAITRTEVAKIGVKLYEYIKDKLCNDKNFETEVIESTNFSDVSNDEWYSEYVIKSTKYGIIFGDTEGTFRPNDNITRGEFSSVIVNIMKLIDKIFLSLCQI